MQPASFAFSPRMRNGRRREIAKYPPGRQASAVISLLWRGQEQEGWVPQPMIESVAQMLSMPFIRVLEVATFYTMFNLEPVGTYLVQVCTTTPCWLRGSDAVVEACKKHIASASARPIPADGKFTWMEVECLGACVTRRCCRSARISMRTSTAHHRKADRRSARRHAVKPGRRTRRISLRAGGGATTLTDRRS